MSDALTDIQRDSDRTKLRDHIDELERQFMSFPTVELAVQLKQLWIQYLDIPAGYWGRPSYLKPCERIDFYASWNPDKQSIPPATGHTGVVLTLGKGTGSIPEQLAEYIEEAVRMQVKGPIMNSVFEVELVVKPKRLSCIDCPKITTFCENPSVTRCSCYNEQELKYRLAAVQRGRDIYNQYVQEGHKDGS